MNKRLLIYTIAFLLSGVAFGQPKIDEVMKSVESNSNVLKAERERINAVALTYKTDILPENPEIEYSKVLQSGTGESEILVKQSFLFPTAYFLKCGLSKQQVSNLENEYSAKRQDILLEAKNVFLEIVYHNKQMKFFAERLEQVKEIKQAMETSFKQGNVGRMDYNKAALEYQDLSNQYNAILVERNNELQRLAELNGGVAIDVSDQQYDQQYQVTDFQTLKADFIANDPTIAQLNADVDIAKKSVAVQRSLTLPKLSVGYRNINPGSNSVNGVVVGMTIPLWENRNKVKAQKANMMYKTEVVNQYQVAYTSALQQTYNRVVQKQSAYMSLSDLLKSSNNNNLLFKAYKGGNISILDLFQELDYYYKLNTKWLEQEKEYYQELAKLYKYKL
ncbi:MAG: TolC family protein [Bacteroidales bacterium]|nr:TolC family protein [Bacteroidales bacterium]